MNSVGRVGQFQRTTSGSPPFAAGILDMLAPALTRSYIDTRRLEDMTLTVHLPHNLEKRLQHEAERQGISADTLTLQLLDQHLPANEAQGTLTALLRSWVEEGDTREQRETGEYLVQTLDEDRLSERRLFPLELKGVTW
jgi:hypothetical protein